MTDVFLSYAHEDQAFVRRLVPMLESEGLSVWWDHTIPPGKSWNDVIAREIEEAKACIVVWSAHSVTSEWVQEEATLAKEAGKYLPMQIGNAPPPVGFRRIQAANLTAWDGDASNTQWRMLVNEAIALARGGLPQPTHATPKPAPMPPKPTPTIAIADEPTKDKKSSKAGLIAAMAVAALAIGAGGWWLRSQSSEGGAVAATSVNARPTSTPTAMSAASAAPPADNLAGAWKLLPISYENACKLSGSLTIGAPGPNRLCTFNAEEVCATIGSVAEEKCTLSIDGDRVKITNTVVSSGRSDNKSGSYSPDNFTLTISGAELKGTFDNNGRPATFTRQSVEERDAAIKKAASTLASRQAWQRIYDAEQREKDRVKAATPIGGTMEIEFGCGSGMPIPHLFKFEAGGKWSEFHGDMKGTWTLTGDTLVIRDQQDEYRLARAADNTYSGNYRRQTENCSVTMKRFL